MLTGAVANEGAALADDCLCRVGGGVLNVLGVVVVRIRFALPALLTPLSSRFVGVTGLCCCAGSINWFGNTELLIFFLFVLLLYVGYEKNLFEIFI